MICSGLYTALITPFDAKGNLDHEGLCFHIDRQIEAGVSGLVLLGTTGEAATLTTEEKKESVLLAKKRQKTLPLMLGCGSYSTQHTLENIYQGAEWGADFALVISPFYNKPTQEGIFRHFEYLSHKSPIPIVIYNNPSRTGVNIEIETIVRLASLDKICGIKDCSNNLTQISDIVRLIKQKNPSFSLFSGDDNLIMPIMLLGGDGAISGGANLFPKKIAALIKACQEGSLQKAREIHLELTPIFKALCFESNPIPLKAALQLVNLPSGDPRLPLTPLNQKFLSSLKEALYGQT